MTATLYTPHHGRTSYPVAYIQHGFFWLTVGGREVPFNADEIKEVKHNTL
jgi:hypothetical protein